MTYAHVHLLDHLGKPDVRGGRVEPWKTRLAELAGRPNVARKISGLLTEAGPDAWTPADVRPYLDHVLFGSDWPVLRLAGDYPTRFGLVQEAVTERSEDEKRKLFNTNAEGVYRT